jgi:hypothetical protein
MREMRGGVRGRGVRGRGVRGGGGEIRNIQRYFRDIFDIFEILFRP